ncbi:hypothetical protein P7C70_g4191, partial [Phenoliferia sp. Uapishka_3]
MANIVPDTTTSSRTELEKGDKPETTFREDVADAGMSYILTRHGRIDLVPMPSDDPAAQFFCYLVLGPETLFDRPDRLTPVNSTPREMQATPWYSPYITFKRWSTAPWSRLPLDIVTPLAMATRLPVLLPTLAFSVAFTYANVLMTVEIPALVGTKYGLNSEQVGLQFIGAILGALLGEPIAGYGSDRYMEWRTRRANGGREPEWRLPLAIPGYVLAAVGIIVFGVQLQNTPSGVWSVTVSRRTFPPVNRRSSHSISSESKQPIVGVAIALFGVQIITTVVYTYVVESQPPALVHNAPLLVVVFRQTFSFTGGFYFNIMFAKLGSSAASGLLAALACGVGLICTFLCLLYGKRWRMKGE